MLSRISLAGECEQLFSVRFDVVAEKDALAFPGKNCAESLLAFDQGAVRQILAVTVKQVEGDEAGCPFLNRRS